mgnify:CR=1 FL=1
MQKAGEAVEQANTALAAAGIELVGVKKAQQQAGSDSTAEQQAKVDMASEKLDKASQPPAARNNSGLHMRSY